MKRRGASLIWAIVVSSVLFSVAVTVSTFVIKESQMSVRMDESTKAYAAAESGIEWGKYCLSKKLDFCKDDMVSAPYTFTLDDSTYVVSFDRQTVSGEDKIESLGTSGGVNRKLEYVVKPEISLAQSDIAAALSITGSYTQQFDYWAAADSYGSIGIGNADGSKAIYFEHYLESPGVEKIRLVAKNDTETKESDNKVIIDNDKVKVDKKYNTRVRIDYTRDLLARLTITTKNFSGAEDAPEYFCVSPVLVVDLRTIGISPSDLTKYYFSGGTPIPHIVDGSADYYTLTTGSTHFANMMAKGVTQAATFTLNYAAADANGSVSGNLSQQVASGASGTAVLATPVGSYSFINWSDGSTQNPRTDTNVTANISVMANFAILPEYTVTVAAGTGGTNPIGSGTVKSGVSITISASANVGYTFNKWTGSSVCNNSTSNPLSIIVTGDTACTANFSVITWQSDPSVPGIQVYYTSASARTWSGAGLYCSSVGGRLPTPTELGRLYTYKNKFSGSLSGSNFWTNMTDLGNSNYALVIHMDTGSQSSFLKTNSLLSRCVK